MTGQITKTLEELVEGDRTPWYEVLSSPVVRDDDQVMLRVKHFNTGEDGEVYGAKGDTVPVEDTVT